MMIRNGMWPEVYHGSRTTLELDVMVSIDGWPRTWNLFADGYQIFLEVYRTGRAEWPTVRRRMDPVIDILRRSKHDWTFQSINRRTYLVLTPNRTVIDVRAFLSNLLGRAVR